MFFLNPSEEQNLKNKFWHPRSGYLHEPVLILNIPAIFSFAYLQYEPVLVAKSLRVVCGASVLSGILSPLSSHSGNTIFKLLTS